jgi:hypothetical protein
MPTASHFLVLATLHFSKFSILYVSLNSSSKKLSLACAARRLNQPKKNPLYKEERVIEKQTNKFLKTKFKKKRKEKRRRSHDPLMLLLN